MEKVMLYYWMEVIAHGNRGPLGTSTYGAREYKIYASTSVW